MRIRLIELLIIGLPIVCGVTPKVLAQELTSRDVHLNAINDYFGHGVRPPENAVVRIYDAFGPHPENATLPDEFFQQLGIKPPPEDGNYFSYFNGSPEENQQFNQQLDRAMQAPWTRDECPLIFQWITSEQEPVETVIQAIQRPRWYSPIVPGYDEHGRRQGIFMTLLPATQQYRGVARYLVCRAMLHTTEKQYEKAWNDLHQCHRLGRMVTHGSTLIDYLVGVAINNIAAEAMVTFVEHTQPSAAQLAIYRSDLGSLPQMRDPARLIDLTERLMAIDVVDAMEAGDYEMLQTWLFDAPLTRWERLALIPVDWDLVRHRCHLLFNEIVRISEIRNPIVRSDEAVKLEYRMASRRHLTTSTVIKEILQQPTVTAAYSTIVSDQLTGMLLPATAAVDSAATRGLARIQLTDLFLATEQFRRRFGRYPDSLQDLLSIDAGTVTTDPFTLQPLKYARTEKGFTIYSVGANRQDDGGRTHGEGDLTDDIRVTVPTNKQ